MPRSLILEPTRELALQVAENFQKYGKHLNLVHALLIGGESMGDQRAVLDKGVDVLIATPGRLLDLFERGRILLIGSITAELTAQGDAAYAASKAAVAHLTRQFAREWVRQGINVNAIQPGYIRSELAGDWFDSEGGKAQIAAFHRRRLQSADSLVPMLLYFLSDSSRETTGTVMTLDDGQSL